MRLCDLTASEIQKNILFGTGCSNASVGAYVRPTQTQKRQATPPLEKIQIHKNSLKPCAFWSQVQQIYILLHETSFEMLIWDPRRASASRAHLDDWSTGVQNSVCRISSLRTILVRLYCKGRGFSSGHYTKSQTIIWAGGWRWLTRM